MSANRYMSAQRVEELIADAQKRVMYYAPDKQAVIEHGKINNIIAHAMRELIEICPEGRELSIAMTHLWEARNAANGAVAIGKPLDEEAESHQSKWG